MDSKLPLLPQDYFLWSCKAKTIHTMRRQHIFISISILLFACTGIAQSTGTFTDPRDGQTYTTISFKNASTGTTYTWMAQNLNYKMPGSYAYDDHEDNRKELGLLYTWESAIKACPCDWHLATDTEWSLLVDQFGGTDKAGEALKSTNGWKEGGNGTNSSGFNALPAGIRRNNGYDVLGYFAFWWSSTPAGVNGKVWGWDISYGGPDMSIKSKVFRYDVKTLGGLSVRCVRD
ncbi:hypothetical protein DN53_00520 [Flagellimonas olearia]|uniref:Fibrobacter succinogenes major paralogous domain-containing protein n=2 Tax=Flagellimonas olearia TaxID=552546 RepID=A0A444VPJ9_9FLAO|nr:hypothetical protein DN53_00520 [Allomuricauda olearia]